MSNNEIIDSYLTGRMSAAEKAEFEQRLTSDPGLQGEYAFEKALVEGIQKARATQLKTLLSQIPITSATVGGGTTPALLKIASTLLITGAIGTGIYLYTSDGEESMTATEPPPMVQPAGPQMEPNPDETPQSPVAEEGSESDANTKTPSAGEKKQKPTETAPVTKPRLDLVDPSMDAQPEVVVENPVSEPPPVTVTESDLEVEVGNTYSKKYSFHYQFRNGKLLLYGPFDKSLYEILEIHHGDSQSTFLFYKDLYYMLDRDKKQVTPLKAVENTTLIEKLKEFSKD